MSGMVKALAWISGLGGRWASSARACAAPLGAPGQLAALLAVGRPVLAGAGPYGVVALAMGAPDLLGRSASDERAEDTSDEPLTLDTLFRRHVDDVHRIVARLLGPGASAADVEDLTQQIFLAAHRALPSFRGESKPTTWLYGIASRMVISHLRRRRCHRRMLERLENEALELSGARPDHAELHFARREELRRVWSALMKIDPRKRVAFMLYELEGLSGREIAEALEIPEATVFTRLHHARRELLAELGPRRKEAR